MVVAGLLLSPISSTAATREGEAAGEALSNAATQSIAAAVSNAPSVSSTGRRSSYWRAYLAMGAGVVLTVSSFLLAESADRAYERYRQGVDPGAIEEDYQEARRLDRWSTATLLTGQGAIALGLYWRFIRHPASAERTGALEETGPEWTLGPNVGRSGAGVALAYRFP